MINAINKVKYFEENTVGRDFVVGDIHGCYDHFLTMLKHIAFDKEKDRMFSCGDLIDRGQNSFECAQLIEEPWFHAVQGNHEQFMIGAIVGQDRDYWAGWVNNGGIWHTTVEVTDGPHLHSLARKMAQLPLMMVIGKDSKDRFNVVHGELMQMRWKESGFGGVDISDADIDNWTFNNVDEEQMTWSRMHINNWRRMGTVPHYQTNKLSITYCGHNVVRGLPVVVGRQMYIDTGCGFGLIGINMTVVEPKQKIAFVYSLQEETVTQLPYADIENYTTQFGESDE